MPNLIPSWGHVSRRWPKFFKLRETIADPLGTTITPKWYKFRVAGTFASSLSKNSLAVSVTLVWCPNALLQSVGCHQTSWQPLLLFCIRVVLYAADTDHIHILGMPNRGRFYVVSGATLTHAIL
jgi:hypothetical protein